VGDRDDGDPLAFDPVELGEDRLAGVGVEVAGGLVGEQHRRLVYQRPRDRDPLFLPARQLRRLVVEPVAQSEAPEQVCGPVARVARVERRRKRDVLDGGERRQQVKVLEDEADRLLARRRALGDGEVRHVRPREEPPAVRRVVEQPEHVEQRRFAGAARADDGDELAGRGREVDGVERDDRLGAAAGVPLRHPVEFDAIHGDDGGRPRRR
jgi:hypothetical protein